MIQKNTTKFVVSGVVMDYIDDTMFVVIACFQLKMLIIPILDVNVLKFQMIKTYVQSFLNKFLDKNAYRPPCIPPEYCVSESNGKYATANEWCHVISQNPIMPALINHFFVVT